jgi:ABC transporter transmembrane region 2
MCSNATRRAVARPKAPRGSTVTLRLSNSPLEWRWRTVPYEIADDAIFVDSGIMRSNGARNAAYYHFSVSGELANPDQRIAEDIRAFTVTTLSFVLMADKKQKIGPN